MRKLNTKIGFFLILMSGLATLAHAHMDETHASASDAIDVKVVISSTVDAAGQPLSFPTVPGKITIAEIIVGPEGVVDWHIHENPLAAYVLEGQLTIDYGSAGIKVFNPGDGIIEAVNWPHRAEVSSVSPVKLIAFFAGDEATPNSEPVEAPTQ